MPNGCSGYLVEEITQDLWEGEILTFKKIFRVVVYGVKGEIKFVRKELLSVINQKTKIAADHHPGFPSEDCEMSCYINFLQRHEDRLLGKRLELEAEACPNTHRITPGEYIYTGWAATTRWHDDPNAVKMLTTPQGVICGINLSFTYAHGMWLEMPGSFTVEYTPRDTTQQISYNFEKVSEAEFNARVEAGQQALAAAWAAQSASSASPAAQPSAGGLGSSPLSSPQQSEPQFTKHIDWTPPYAAGVHGQIKNSGPKSQYDRHHPIAVGAASQVVMETVGSLFMSEKNSPSLGQIKDLINSAVQSAFPSISIPKVDVHWNTASHGRNGTTSADYRTEQENYLRAGNTGRVWSTDISQLRTLGAQANLNPRHVDYAIAKAEISLYGINDRLTQKIMAKADTAKWFKADEDTREEIDQNLRTVVSGMGFEPSSWSDTYRSQFEERQAIFRQLEPLVQEYLALEKGTEAPASLMNRIHQLEVELSNAFDRHLAPSSAPPRVFRRRITY